MPSNEEGHRQEFLYCPVHHVTIFSSWGESACFCHNAIYLSIYPFKFLLTSVSAVESFGGTGAVGATQNGGGNAFLKK